MYVIGLTGGIASGKSTVSAILRNEGAYIIDTDRIAHDITLPHQPAWRDIVEHFGKGILLTDGTIDRRRLGQMVFNDAKKRTRLEEITHPKIKSKVIQEIEEAKLKAYSLAVLDVPLLFEVGWRDMADEVWVVYVDEQIQLSRLIARNNLSRQDALARIAAQMSLVDKIKFADVVINNNGSIEDTQAQVIEAFHQATQKS
ncbi:Dephospho-CoA kinase [bioreactor metagenome]|uniref:Dephospho-CoA kinase n=1 Tax=bioreactor metagenome TaxID=1076179 RepID=A0A645BBG3_9ZZZZ